MQLFTHWRIPRLSYGRDNMFNFDPNTQGMHLLNDLADALNNSHAIDAAAAVLIEWGIINADQAATFMEDVA